MSEDKLRERATLEKPCAKTREEESQYHAQQHAAGQQEMKVDEWIDQDDQYTDAINAAHPLKTGNHELRSKANEMVSNRHSKGALVDLVNWLLTKDMGET